MQTILEKTKTLLKLRNYSSKTVKSYLFFINKYLAFSKKNKFKDKNQAIEAFLLKKLKENKSPQTINLALNSIKFLYHQVLKQKIKLISNAPREVKNYLSSYLEEKSKK